MVTKTDIAKYALLPGILPRLLALFRSGFAHVAYLLAIIYQGARLLPANHPYLNARNFGQFGVRHVIAAAANNLVLKRQNFDQIFIFVVLLTGICMLFAQMLLFLFTLTLANPALASALEASNMLSAPTLAIGGQDIAGILLDRVFGVPGIFNSCISDVAQACLDITGTREVIPAATPFPWPFHIALHRMFQFYSHGIFVIGVFVLLYFITTIVAETAQSGTPFGQRFNKTWAPVRLILFLALLLPISSDTTSNAVRVEGLNGAQLILLKVVQLGSNFATNGWLYFNDTIAVDGGSEHYLAQQKQLIATPNMNVTEVKELLQFIAVAKTCRMAYNAFQDPTEGAVVPDVNAYVVRPNIPAGGYSVVPSGISGRNDAIELENLATYEAASDFTLHGDITLRFGQLGPLVGGVVSKKYNNYLGNVSPVCGDLTIKHIGGGQPGAVEIQKQYFEIVRNMWEDTVMNDHASCLINRQNGEDLTCPKYYKEADIKTTVEDFTADFKTAIEAGIAAQQTSGLFALTPELRARGWAGAALWYNQIAEMNGAVTSASFNIPQPSRLPFLMEKAFRDQNEASSNLTKSGKFGMDVSNNLDYGVSLSLKNKNDVKILGAMVTTYNIWNESKVANAGSMAGATGNVMLDFVNMVFGTQGVFEMRKNTDVHPLAQLSALGRGMMDAVVRNVAIATSLEMGGGLLDVFSKFSTEHAKSAGRFFFSVVATTMGMSIILYYVLPIMPFLYFMFAVSGWLKSIFEAMVAMPLWALGHLRIDGEGMMGPGAMNGYFLLLEIFLRPILILVGMVTSLATFSAFVGVLNIVFDQVVSNIGGFDTQLEAEIANGAAGISKMDSIVGGVDEFFFTAMYVIICYMMATSSFKLVDAIPNQILRWMGVQLSTFQENAGGDPVGKLGSQVQRGGILVTNQLRNRVSGLAELG